MNPIFNEYRTMLNDFGVDLSQYDKDKLWIDRMIIRGIGKNGEDKKICRLKVNDDLEYEYKFYKDVPSNEELENYEETYQRMYETIAEREKESIGVIKGSIEKYPECSLYCATSMGKDSKLVEHLLKKVTTDFTVIFNNTTCDSADVYKEVKKRPEIIMVTPKDENGRNLSLYKMAETNGFATRHHRWCCGIFKEGAIKDYLSDKKNIIEYLGMRNEESATRADYEFEKTDDRFDETWHIFLPIRKWTELEVWLYTIHNNIPINIKYKKGYRRVGCHVICPYYTSSTWVLDKYWCPFQYNRFHEKLSKDFWDREISCRLNCTEKEYHTNWNGGIVRKEPTEEVIKEFMEYKGFENIELAKQYFQKNCEDCGKKVYKKDEVAMNLKFFGRETNKFRCKKCFMKRFGWTKEQWDEQVARFKQTGCTLF